MPGWLGDLGDLGDLDGLSAGAVYLTVFALVFVESGLLVGFFLPGDSLLFAAGLLAAEPGTGLSLPLLAVGVFGCAVAGDAVGYWSGRRLGRRWLLERAGRAARHVERAERFYAVYGWWAVVVARFVPWVRTFTPIVAGVGAMPYLRFLSANLVGAACWGVGLVCLGYGAAGVPVLRWGAYAVAATAVLGSAVAPAIALWRRRRPPRDRPVDDTAPDPGAP